MMNSESLSHSSVSREGGCGTAGVPTFSGVYGGTEPLWADSLLRM